MSRFFIIALILCFAQPAYARPRRTYQQGQPIQNVARAMVNTAQGVAETCAQAGRLFHPGGNGSLMEGVGMASTPEAAIRNCCYYGQIQVVDQGVSQGSNGMWYACIRGR
jgi:hypothetical protein